ncbi:hypothetical protein ACFPTX_00845 [Pseudomonas sp. GCM10022188]|uniref:hypothetical protein n=1 Tax=Pseudomonas TaxID=286 RepID=UPI001E2F9B74|nr:hypothetical protein [Pseudomonas oryzagri]MCC6075150.1 hypothetical protein [Pseudomonas oryzagri]
MTFLIDAWLDRPQPYLRILDRDSGRVCAQLDRDALAELQEQGDFDLASLSSSEPSVLKELLQTLFLFYYARALRPQG